MTVACTKCYREFPGAVDGCDCCRDLVEFIAEREQQAAALDTLVVAVRCITDEWTPATETFDTVVEALRHELERLNPGRSSSMTTYEFTPPKYTLGEKQERSGWDGKFWKRQVTMADGRILMCTVAPTRKVRIAFRGRQMGWQYIGQVLDMTSHERLLYDRVGGSVGVRGLLTGAGIYPRKMGYCSTCWATGREIVTIRDPHYHRHPGTFICTRCSGTGQTPMEPSLGR